MTTQLKMVATCCNLCGSSESKQIASGTDFEYGVSDDVFTIVRCLSCGLAYMSPRPDVSQLDIIYPPNYANYNVEDDYDAGDRGNLYYKFRYAVINNMIGRWLRKLFPTQNELVMLDIGCADGHALSCIKSASGFTVETHGVDISESAVKKARAAGHQAFYGRFEDVDFPSDHYDLVYASHVIEHVADPKAFICKVTEILKPGGHFVLWTPNIGSVDAQWFREKYWGPYCFPRHWFLFDRHSISKLARAADLEVATIRFNPTGSTWLYTFHSLTKGSPTFARYADLLFPLEGSMKTTFANFVRNMIFTALEIVILLLTGQTSNMGVVMRKPVGVRQKDCTPEALEDAVGAKSGVQA